MSDERLQIEEQLRQSFLFQGLNPNQIAHLADRMEVISLGAGEQLFSEGESAEAMFIVFRGGVRVTRGGEELAVMSPGDHFGEDALLLERPRSATITALGPTMLFCISKDFLEQIIEAFPQVEANLMTTAEGHELIQAGRYPWLGQGEVIHVVVRKHIALLWLALVGPGIVALFSIPFFLLVYLSGIITPALLGGVLVLLALAWGVWNGVDWGNDYYIITNQRVVWLERVVALYDSRQEAPLRTILSVTVETDYIGRVLGYGDVIVRTYTGRIILRNVGRPKEIAALVEQFWKRSREQSKQEESAAIERALRERIGVITPAVPEPIADEEVVSETEERQPGFLQLLLASFFGIRYQEGSIITYRKHWFLLLRRIWVPVITLLVLAFLVSARLVRLYTLLSERTTLVGGVALGTIFAAWLLYEYVDWRNDIYQVTTEHIVDIDRKPLGTEQKRSAPIENILSLEHERKGVLGLIFNFGDVSARIGATRFTFDGVHNPASVQQDIFNRMDERQGMKREAEAARERERMAEWLSTYHRNLDEFQQYGRMDEIDPETG